ncbi:dTDP-4-dehydrorhamnose reductase [Oryzobacter telluris]|uniref:dTDP-4-dehydrorhamnose reductase n=1 Tax=Oryzobacter telluris TaxID=3149179 RepID=UPI00370DDBD2
MARWLVTGAAGMLGRDLCSAAEASGHEVTAAARADLDVLDPAACTEVVAGHDVVVNCAAWTAVDDAETQEAAAFAVNAVGPANLARAAEAAGAVVVQVSTDYVFAGDATQPYPADAPIAPRSAYGRTKAAGEWAVRASSSRAHVVRTAWLYGAGGTSFPATMQRLAGQRETLTVVDDQVGQPTWTVDLAAGILRIVDSGAPFGTWHATGSGQASWFDLARAVFEELGLDPERVTPTTSEAFVRPAPRPAYSVLAHDMWGAAGLEPLPDWREALHRAAPTVLAGA